jgi:iron complex transport system permease protein
MESIEDDRLISEVVRSAVKRYRRGLEHVPDDSPEFVEYHRSIVLKWVFIIACISIMFVVMGVAITIGDTPIGFFETYQIIFNHILHGAPPESSPEFLKDYLVINIRMPRIIIGLIVGSALAACGVVMQNALKNPLADPYTTGVSSGAVFGVTISSLLGVTIVSSVYYISTFVNAFVFSLVPVMIILLISKLRSVSPVTMIMAGISVMYVFNAMSTVLKLMADPNDLADLYKWSVGSLTFVGWGAVPLMLTTTVVGLTIMMALTKKLNILATGDENATAMGVNVDSMRRFLLLIVAMVAAVNVGFVGLIGFVGLVAPHIARIFVGADNRYLLPASVAFGAALLIAADLIGRTIIYPSILQVGVITSFMGGPMFLWLLLRKNSNMW